MAQRKSCRKRKTTEDSEEETAVPKAFGDLITADHIIMLDPEEASCGGDLCALVVQDRFMRWLERYPTPEHATLATTTALRQFFRPA